MVIFLEMQLFHLADLILCLEPVTLRVRYTPETRVNERFCNIIKWLMRTLVKFSVAWRTFIYLSVGKLTSCVDVGLLAEEKPIMLGYLQTCGIWWLFPKAWKLKELYAKKEAYFPKKITRYI